MFEETYEKPWRHPEALINLTRRLDSLDSGKYCVLTFTNKTQSANDMEIDFDAGDIYC